MVKLSLNKIQRSLERQKGKRDHIQSEVKKLTRQLRSEEKELGYIHEAKGIIQKVALLTQQQIQVKLSHIVTLAVESIFGEGHYEFKLEFVEKRGKTEVEFWLIKNGEKISPFDTGGGVVDVINFALRISVWSLSQTPNVLIFDEPFRFLSRDLHDRAGMFLQKVSEELNIQMIIITHSAGLLWGDNSKYFVVVKKEKFSRVKDFGNDKLSAVLVSGILSDSQARTLKTIIEAKEESYERSNKE